MRDAATQDRRRNERAKLRIFREIVKWRRWRHASWLTATAVIRDLRHRFSKRWHVADVKNIAGDDQTTLMVHRNSANIACTFRIYVCLRLRECDCCSTADGSGSSHAPAPSYFEEMSRCRHQKLHWRWPGNPNGRLKFRNLGLFTFTRSQLTLRRRLRGWWRLPEISQTARCRRKKNWPAMTRIDRNSVNTKIYAYEIKQSVSKNFFLLLWTTPRLSALRIVYFPAITRNGFCFHIRQIISRRPWPHRKTEIYIL